MKKIQKAGVEMVDKQRKKTDVRFRRYIKSSSFQRIIAVFITWIILSVAISSEAAPKKYKLEIGDVSQFDIQAPSDIENTVKTRQNAEEKANELEPVVITIENANSEMLNTTYEYFDGLNKLMSDVLASREEMTLEEKIKYYDSKGVYGVLFDIDSESRTMLFTYDGSTKLAQLKDFIIKETLAGLVEKKLMAENLEIERVKSLASISSEFKDPVLNIIAKDALNKILKPNSRIDEEAYKAQKDAFIESYIKENPVIIYKNERIISKDDVVTRDIYEVLKDLNYIDREGKIDYFFYMAVFMIILLLFIFALLFMKNFQRKLYYDKNSVILICVVMLITTLFAWLARRFVPLYSYLLIPVFKRPEIITQMQGACWPHSA
jgi:membrane-associated HD superfamily phosphohydrolase